MKYFIYILILLVTTQLSFSQEIEIPSKEIDSLYKEDQFYIGAHYNLLGKKPSNVSQSGFSSGFQLGYIKDMPINKNRNLAIGLGLGVSANLFNQNILIEKIGENYTYSVLDDSETNYSRNRFNQYLIEVPLEFRWRTSTPTEYKFWRIYTGFKVAYVLANSSKYKGEPKNVSLTKIKDFNALQYGLTLNVGYNTWNIHLYYGLNSIFDNAKINNATISMNTIKIGLIFYLL